jgi:hypothetical protein
MSEHDTIPAGPPHGVHDTIPAGPLHRVHLVLGRDAMGFGATEEDYGAWVAYVAERINDACGCDVIVEGRGACDVQRDYICPLDSDADDRERVHGALQSLWSGFPRSISNLTRQAV